MVLSLGCPAAAAAGVALVAIEPPRSAGGHASARPPAAAPPPRRAQPAPPPPAPPDRAAFVVAPTPWLWWDVAVFSYMAVLHAACLFAPATFSWSAVRCFVVTYFLTGCLGVTLCFHRCLCHRSFVLPKPVEYAAAYLGVLASQSDPMDWVSHHRHHHAHTDTPADPHTPLQGLAWSHLGWVLDRAAIVARLGPNTNVADLAAQPFYVWLEKTYELHILGSAVALYAVGGAPWLVWGYCLRTVCVWHATFAVNSLAHWVGTQRYATHDESRNNAFVALVAFGEGCAHRLRRVVLFRVFWSHRVCCPPGGTTRTTRSRTAPATGWSGTSWMSRGTSSGFCRLWVSRPR